MWLNLKIFDLSVKPIEQTGLKRQKSTLHWLNGMIKNYCSIYMMCINQFIIHTYKLIHFQIETIAYEIHMINKYPSWSHGITQWIEIRFFYHLQRRKRSNITLTLFWIADISVILREELFESGAPITPVLPHSKFSTMTSS